MYGFFFFFFQAEDGIRDLVRSRGLGDVYKRQYHKSPVFTSLPNNLNPLVDGVMKLKLINTTDTWIEVTKSVFDSQEMKVYFNESLVSIRATMKILSGKIAETEFISSGIKRGMKKSLEVLESGRIVASQKKFIMEEGL